MPLGHCGIQIFSAQMSNDIFRGLKKFDFCLESREGNGFLQASQMMLRTSHLFFQAIVRTKEGVDILLSRELGEVGRLERLPVHFQLFPGFVLGITYVSGGLFSFGSDIQLQIFQVNNLGSIVRVCNVEVSCNKFWTFFRDPADGFEQVSDEVVPGPDLVRLVGQFEDRHAVSYLALHQVKGTVAKFHYPQHFLSYRLGGFCQSIPATACLAG